MRRARKTGWKSGLARSSSFPRTLRAGLLALAAAGASVPSQGELSILPLREVRPGMVGEGRTVFSGDSVSTFPVTIIDVIARARPLGSLILFRAGGALLEHSGIIAGMSGSPVYVEGRLLGAIAFAYPMLKDPIGGITPIEEMLSLRAYTDPSEEEKDGIEAGPAAGQGAGLTPDESEPRGATALFPELWERFTARGAGSAFSLPGIGSGSSGLAGDDRLADGARAPRPAGSPEALSVPLALEGWEGPLAAEFSRALGDRGYLAVTVPSSSAGEGAGEAGAASAAAGGAAAIDAGASAAARGRPFEPGSAVAVPLIQGDASVAAIGTVTAVDGDHVFAFGHPLVQGGPVSLPMCGARIHSVMPSAELSFKIGSATAAVGAISQDRRPGIAGTLGSTPEMIPVRVTIHGTAAAPVSYRYRIVRDRILTPFLLPWPVTNSWLHTGWTQGDAVASCRIRVGFNHGSQFERREAIRADAPPLQFANAATLPASLLLTNPFERATLDSIGIDLSVERRNPQAVITNVRCAQQRVRVGDEVRIVVTVEPWRGGSEQREFAFTVRPEWARQRLQVVAASAPAFAEADRERAPGKYAPRNFRQLVELIETFPHDGSLIVRLLAPRAGSLIDGREVSMLPPSIAAAGTESGGRAIIRQTANGLLAETAADTPWILSGREATEVEVIP